MLGGLRILAAIMLAWPALAAAAPVPVRLLLLSIDAQGVEPEKAAAIQRDLEEGAAGLNGIERLPARRASCPAVERSCLVALGLSAGADEVVHATVRQVGGGLVLLLVRLSVAGERIERHSEALPTGAARVAAMRERLVRLVDPVRWVGALTIEATAGSEIWLDGALQGIAPVPTLEGLAPGQHLLRVVRAGQGEARAFVEVRYAEQTRVRVEPRSDDLAVLHDGHRDNQVALAMHGGGRHADVPAVAVPGAGRDDAREAPAMPGAGGDDDPGAVATADRLAPVEVLRWSLLGAGTIAWGAAAWPALEARAIRSEREALRDEHGFFAQSRQQRQRALAARYERRRSLSTVLLGTGTVLALGAGALFLIDLIDEPAGSLTIQAGPGGMTLGSCF